jgi:probable F420-dependent oxidoreductase
VRAVGCLHEVDAVTLSVGIHLPQYGRAASGPAIAEVARQAERLGFADVWVSDHVVHPAAQTYPSPHLYDALLALTWGAASTSVIGLGTSVLVVPQHNAVWLANALASLDALSGGRLTVGVGVGWSEAEFAALGQSFHDRGRRTDEVLEFLRVAWSDDPVTFHGEFVDVDDLRMLPKPAHRIPMWIGGSAAAAYHRAARSGDGFQLIGLDPAAAGEACTRLRAEHPDPSFTISLRTGWDPQGMDPALIADEAAAFEAAGVQHVVSAPWRSNADDWCRSMELLAGIVGLAPR